MSDTCAKYVEGPLLWLAGTSHEEVRGLPAGARLQCQGLGIVMLANYVVLVAIWCEVGWRYFGAFGLFVPGLMLPSMMALGIDRLLLMQSRPYAGVLAPSTPAGVVSSRSASGKRALIAVAFSAFTTSNFMLVLSASSIDALHARDAVQRNAPLVQQLREQAQAENELAQAARSELALRRTEREALDQAIRQAQEVRTKAQAAGDRAAQEAVREQSGVDNRTPGEGDKWRGQKALEAQNLRVVQRVDRELAERIKSGDALGRQIQELAAQVQAADAAHAQHLATLDGRARSDPRYDKPRQGLFADFTAWVRLFADPGDGLGRWVLTLLAWPVLVGIESAVLLAQMLGACSILNLVRDASLRQVAAEAIAASEVRVAAASVRHAGVRVRHADPRHAPGDGQAPPRNPSHVH